MEAVCIVGSPRRQGSTMILVGEVIRALAAHGHQARLFQVGAMDIAYCAGCKACEATGRCAQKDDVEGIVAAMRDARLVLVASPSYWGDVTGQLKVFIDRCTPFSNTNPARTAAFSAMGAAIAVRAGKSVGESMKLVGTMEHYLGHLDIPLAAHFTVEGIGTADDLRARPGALADAYAFGETLAKLLG